MPVACLCFNIPKGCQHKHLAPIKADRHARESQAIQQRLRRDEVEHTADQDRLRAATRGVAGVQSGSPCGPLDHGPTAVRNAAEAVKVFPGAALATGIARALRGG